MAHLHSERVCHGHLSQAAVLLRVRSFCFLARTLEHLTPQLTARREQYEDRGDGSTPQVTCTATPCAVPLPRVQHEDRGDGSKSQFS